MQCAQGVDEGVILVRVKPFARRLARSLRRIGSSSFPACQRPARGRSCAASFARLRKVSTTTSATSRRSQILLWWRRSSAAINAAVRVISSWASPRPVVSRELDARGLEPLVQPEHQPLIVVGQDVLPLPLRKEALRYRHLPLGVGLNDHIFRAKDQRDRTILRLDQVMLAQA